VKTNNSDMAQRKSVTYSAMYTYTKDTCLYTVYGFLENVILLRIIDQ